MPAGWPRRLAVATITIGLMMSVLSNSMTNLALPYIAQDLDITAESSIWIVNATQIALIDLAAAGGGAGRHRRLPPRLSLRAGAVLAGLDRLRLRALAALAAAAGAPSRGWAVPPSWRSSRRWCARSIRATRWDAGSASTPPWSPPRSPPAPRSARRCCRSPPGRSCSPSTCRSASSPSCCPNATCRTPRTSIGRSTCSRRCCRAPPSAC